MSCLKGKDFTTYCKDFVEIFSFLQKLQLFKYSSPVLM